MLQALPIIFAESSDEPVDVPDPPEADDPVPCWAQPATKSVSAVNNTDGETNIFWLTRDPRSTFSLRSANESS